jgi:fused signal recognition particle receptor
MPFWRHRREEPKDPEPVEPGVVGPVREPGDPSPGDPFEIEGSPPAPVEPETPPEQPFDIEGSIPPEPPAQEPPAYAPFDPTAFLAVAPAHTLDQGLEKTRGTFVTQLRGYLGGAGGPAWDEVEETLIAGDVGAALAIDLVERARGRRHPDGPEGAIREALAALLVDRDPDWSPQPATDGGPAVVLVVGVNGTGKTTTIGKIAARYIKEGRSIILAAADTFRAAAIDQLRIWAGRAGVPVVAHAPGADPGAVVYDALDAAIARKADMVIADTAGRLHTKANLMDELTKVRRIVDKRLPGAQAETLFVLDATTGQNGLAQAKAFHDAVGLTGIVLTKLDSTAKGGIVFAIEDGLKVPVRFVGVGEGINDLLPFDPKAFVDALFAEGQAPTG